MAYIRSFVGIALAAATPAFAQLSTVREGTGFNQPVFAAAQPGAGSTLWVVEKPGTIRTLNLAGNANTGPGSTILTESNIAAGAGSEEGLLGLAFHPNFTQNGYFYVYKTDASSNLEIARYTYSGGAATARQTVLQIAHPGQQNHNGGWLGFGPDGYLYAGVGDGGGSNDGPNNAQNTSQLLGKMLRLDVNGDAFTGDANRNYAIPAGNPGVGVDTDPSPIADSYADEIWAYGLRNPWRNAFDRSTGDLWIADVGQDLREEVNKQAAGVGGGQNYGWRIREGFQDNPSVGGTLDPANRVDPIHDYDSSQPGFGSITGGYVYRGPGLFDGIQSMDGLYFFADYNSGKIWTLEQLSAGGVSIIDRTAALSVPDFGGPIGAFDAVSFAQDDAGNLYIVDFDGEIFRVVPEPASLGLLGAVGAILLQRRRLS